MKPKRTSKNRILSVSIISFLLVFLFSTNQVLCQEQIQQSNAKGLSTTTFHTSYGKITIYIPVFKPNEAVSATIGIEPLGSSVKQKEKNKAKIKDLRLMYGSQIVGLQADTLSFTTGQTNNALQLLNTNGKTISKTTVPPNNSSIGSSGITSIPSYIVAGEITKIDCACDGLLSNNTLKINNTDIPILAESEKEVFTNVPNTISGKSDVHFENNDVVIDTIVHILKTRASVGKADLKPKETTTLSINISGLAGLEESVPVLITNNSPSNIVLQGGNVRQFSIHPAIDAPTGSYNHTVGIVAKKRGTYSITVQVQQPENEISESSTESLLCNCYINGQSYLISPDACQSLEGNCSENIELEPEEITEDVLPPIYDCDIPTEITSEDDLINFQINDHNKNDIIATSVSYRSIGEEKWQLIDTDNTVENGLEMSWNPPLGVDGVNEIRTMVVNNNNTSSQRTDFIHLSITPETLIDPNLNVSFSISENDIRRNLDRARSTGDRIQQEREKLGNISDRLWEAIKRKRANQAKKNELVVIDKVLDKIPKTYKDPFRALIDSLINLKKQLPQQVDTLALKKAVDDAQKRLDDCNKRLEELKQEQKGLEKKKADLKKQLDDVQQAIYDMYTENGFSGDFGYHEDGRPHYGYMGDENANTDLGDKPYELRKQLRDLKRPYLKTLKRLDKLPSEIAEAQEECDKLNEALEKAKQAALKGDQYMAAGVEADDICRQIKSLLKPLKKWCNANPSHCTFKEKLIKLLEDCPKDTAALDGLWEEFDKVVAAKKSQEEKFGNTADGNQNEVNRINNEIKNAKVRIKALQEQQRREYEEAERKRKQQAQELENARQRVRDDAKREIEEARRREAKPEPYLDEPVDPRDDQLKYQAQAFIFKSLYIDYFVAKGPCDCTTKAMAFANNTNTIVTDIIGGIAIGVAFAPLEAFPGVSLAGRLGIGAVKALAGALFGGQSFSEELTKNLFNTIGGEIFPKLVGNGFVGNRLNDLAGKGLDEILEAEGVRSISWAGKTKIKNCGEVTGKTTMLINPNTGWVTILIKIEGCPLVVVKYKVNDNGVPISTPIVKQIRG